jgi:hypothetical protein
MLPFHIGSTLSKARTKHTEPGGCHWCHRSITFEVGVRVLGGLMSLGYTIGPILRRTTTSYQAAPRGPDGGPVVKLDSLEGLGQFVQVGLAARAAKGVVGRMEGYSYRRQLGGTSENNWHLHGSICHRAQARVHSQGAIQHL